MMFKADQLKAHKLKRSASHVYTAIITDTGFRIYQNYTFLLAREGEEFILFKKAQKLPFIKDIEFVGDSLTLILSIEDKGIIIWDETNQTIVETLNFAIPESISYCRPFIFMSIQQSIAVYNSNLQTFYRYISNPTPFNQNNAFIQNANNLPRYNYFLQNYVIDDTVFVYQHEGVIMVENLQRNLIVGLSSDKLTQVLEQTIIAHQEQMLQAIVKQQEKYSLVHDQTIKQAPALYVSIKGDTLVVGRHDQPQSIRLFKLDWLTCKIQLLKEYLRGSYAKELQIFISPRNDLAVISHEGEHSKKPYDSTLHIFFDNQTQKNSMRRYYFRSGTIKTEPYDKMRDTHVYFGAQQDSLTLVSLNDFIIDVEIDLKSEQEIIVTLKDQKRYPWLKSDKEKSELIIESEDV